MKIPRITFIIPVRNDASRLGRSLRAIRESEFDLREVEIVVVDNGSVDDSRRVAESAGAQVLDLPNANVTELRNIAAAAARADVLAFCDADNLISPSWLRFALDLLKDPRVGAVGAPCIPPEPCTWVQRSYDGLRDHRPGTRRTRWLGAGNMAVRRVVFENIGGFDESLNSCEDVDLCFRMQAAGWKLLTDSRLVNVHLGDPETLGQVFLGEIWRGRDNLRVSLHGSSSFADLQSIVIPILSLGFIWAALLGLLAAPLGGLLLSGVCVSGFVALAAVRGLHMIRNSDRIGWRQTHQALAVAGTYNLARALALVWTVDHHRNLKT